MVRIRLPGGGRENVRDLQIRLDNQYYLDLCLAPTRVLAARTPFQTGFTTSVAEETLSAHTKESTLDKNVLLLSVGDLAPTSANVA